MLPVTVLRTRLVRHSAPLAPAQLRGVKAAAGRGGARKGTGGRPAGGSGEESEESLEQLGSAAEEFQASVQEGAESLASAAERAAADVQKQAGGVADAAFNVAEDAADTAANALSGAIDAAAANVAPPPGARPAAAGSPSQAVEPQAEPLLLPEVTSGSNGSHADAIGSPGADVENLKQRLIAAVAGLDRGVAATKDDGLRVENLLLQLESAGGAVVLGALPTALEGRWRLIYSSAFSSGSLGGARAGPPTGLAPLTLGPVFQDISVDTGELDNVVQLSPKFSLASLPGVDAKPPTLTLRLRHKFEVSAGATVRVTFERTAAKASGGIFAWLDSVPEVATPRVPEALRPRTGATFDVTFVDEGLRVTRGDRGEVRIFLKEPSQLY